ncbi:hypothetical protein CC2G_009367 [Coprinopsis cinerea AmutBmut pab1-1]|nr:hypothetical protein CC2G_009367 [Coprinopsis cinerea AmutBmut pab1-1]
MRVPFTAPPGGRHFKLVEARTISTLVQAFWRIRRLAGPDDGEAEADAKHKQAPVDYLNNMCSLWTKPPECLTQGSQFGTSL